MPDLRKITTRTELVFDAWVEGPEDGPLVLMLHGFPQSRHTWREQVPALAAAGFRAVAPDQRGYSPGARPDPAELAHYAFDRLITDVLDLADALGHAHRRFHLVGHDWSGQVSWGVAAQRPERLASLAVLSRPHPASFLEALQSADGDQSHRSRHHRAFLDASTGAMLLADDSRRLRQMLAEAGVPPGAIDDYVATLREPEAMEAALAWYRALPQLRTSVGQIVVPTLYIWGDADQTVGRAAAEGTARYVTAPFRFVVLPGVGHFVTDEAAATVSRLLVEHVAAHPSD
jgi:pimeloyl-ACP methyl ester carboxylesterase